MDVSSMLSIGAQDNAATADARRQHHTNTARHNGNMLDEQPNGRSYSSSNARQSRGSGGSAGAASAATGSTYARSSPAKKDQKHVVFQLIDTEDPRIQARLPMRVMISPHDTTDSIITTVKNFYGLYEYGVSFENKEGISIIAAYGNFENDMVVFVRTVAQPPTVNGERLSLSPKRPTLGAPFEMRPHGIHFSPSRSHARSAGMRSLSPHSELDRRSTSIAPAAKARPLKSKSKENSVAGDADGYSSDEGGNGSVASSRRSKTEQVNAEISVENIVEGGRRKRAFESSELPLFVPPQVPMTASNSSISPQRRNGPANMASPYAYANQQTFSYNQPLPSPQSYGSGPNQVPSGAYANYPQAPRQLRGRSGVLTYPPARSSNGAILPTPDPTVGSVISDEDVALQLMRLGDASNFSHGRTSTSTVDDAFSGKAEVASSDEEDAGEEEERSAGVPAVPRWPKEEQVGPQRKKQRLISEPQYSDAASADDYEASRGDDSLTGESDSAMPKSVERRPSKSSNKPTKPARHNSASLPSSFKSNKPRSGSMGKPAKSKPLNGASSQPQGSQVPMSPASLPSQSRKASIASASTLNFQQQHPLGLGLGDEEDLSTKPRCQRCRKSKKGCDRQRPCGRCKDAGIGVDGCLSEDEGNGRKGRYGRHMGVPVKKSDEMLGGEMGEGGSVGSSGGGSVMLATNSAHVMPNGGYFLAPAPMDKNKKRKR